MSGNIEPLTVEELLGLKDVVLTRNVNFEYIADGEVKKMEREVVFRRLTYEEIDKLRTIPETEPLRYASAVIYAGSISPKFERADEIRLVQTHHQRGNHGAHDKDQKAD